MFLSAGNSAERQGMIHDSLWNKPFRAGG
jgi:hypothetical protein